MSANNLDPRACTALTTYRRPYCRETATYCTLRLTVDQKVDPEQFEEINFGLQNKCFVAANECLWL